MISPLPVDTHLADQLETAARIIRGNLRWEAFQNGEWREQPRAFSVLYFLSERIDIRILE